jgi:hypothetical protein
MSDLLIPIKEYADTYSNLTSNNPVLLERQLVIETDTGRMKLGNGVNNYNSLSYLPISPEIETLIIAYSIGL